MALLSTQRESLPENTAVAAWSGMPSGTSSAAEAVNVLLNIFLTFTHKISLCKYSDHLVYTACRRAGQAQPASRKRGCTQTQRYPMVGQATHWHLMLRQLPLICILPRSLCRLASPATRYTLRLLSPEVGTCTQLTAGNCVP